jgi:peptidoglycan/LPS O-acetylase OafA/YrhL
MQELSLSEKLALSKGRPTGFDYLRLGLSISVVCMHSAITSKGLEADIALWMSPLRPLIRMTLPMFFALSGFLVAGSLFRSASLVQFLGLRVIRIYPALIIEVVLSALLLGPLLTTVPLASYFESPVFGLYLMNVSGDIHYFLPGVFENNPYPNIVNAQLWTVPVELGCYISLSALTIVGVKKRFWIAPAVTLMMMLGYFLARLIKFHGQLPFIVGGIPGFLLVVCFVCGVSLYVYRDRLPWSRSLCAISGIASLLLVGVVPYGEYIVVPVVSYFTVCLGATNVRKLGILKGADYSYGIFLYGFVIQQTVVFLCPWAREWWVNILLCVPLAAAVAALSWHLIEKPTLKLRRYLKPRSAQQPNIVTAGPRLVEVASPELGSGAVPIHMR